MKRDWTICPRCKTSTEAAQQSHADKVRASYGTIPIDEWEALRDTPLPIAACDALREDWEIGIRDGVFSISYGAWCRTCGFKFEFKHEQEIK